MNISVSMEGLTKKVRVFKIIPTIRGFFGKNGKDQE